MDIFLTVIVTILAIDVTIITLAALKISYDEWKQNRQKKLEKDNVNFN